MKKFLSLILTLVLIMSIFPLGGIGSLTVSAEETEGYYTYTVFDGEATITDVDESISGDITIPSTLGGYPATSIGYEAFYGCDGITSVVITNNVTNIGIYAFASCDNLANITIGEGVTSIGEDAFYGTKYYNNSENWQDGALYIGKHLIKVKTSVFGKFNVREDTLSIAECTFAGCKDISEIELSEKLLNIDEYAFSNCDGITNIIIPDSVISIGNYAFKFCYNLENIMIGKGVTSIGEDAFFGTKYYNNASNWQEGALYIGKHLIKVKNSSFGKFNVREDTLSMADGAFYNCIDITAIKLPETLKNIGKYTFYNCECLTSINIPNSITQIGYRAFIGCSSLKNVYINDIGAWCNIEFLDFYANPLNYADNLYIGGELVEEVVIPEGVKQISRYAFLGGDFKKVTIPYTVESIGDHAFYGCDLTIINIPNSVTSVGESAFSCCEDLQKVIFNANVNYIESYVFENCRNLKVIYIPKNIKLIKRSAFCCELVNDWNALEIENVYYEGSAADWAEVTILPENEGITSAKIHYNSTPAMVEVICTDHIYTNDCDDTCNTCGYVRVGYGHYYRNACDKSCNVCGATRSIRHSYAKSITKATLTKNGQIEEKCGVCGVRSSYTTIRRISSVKLSYTSYTYNGKIKQPSVTVKDSAGKTISSKYYTVKYASGRKNVGKYKVTVTFKGNYSGTKTLYFTINPAKTTVSKLTPGKKSIKVYITKKTSQVTGYQIQYSTSKTFKSYKTKTITSYKTTSATLKSLSAKKTYYVRVRTYKTVNGTKYYSGWSSYKYTKTK